jgi:hypothetical protein
VHRRLRATAIAVALALPLLGCETQEEPISPDPEGLEEPADAPDGTDDELDQEEGTGEPAVEGDTEGQMDPGDEDDD